MQLFEKWSDLPAIFFGTDGGQLFKKKTSQKNHVGSKKNSQIFYHLFLIEFFKKQSGSKNLNKNQLGTISGEKEICAN